MRPVLHGDVTSVARALLNVPKKDRPRLCRQIFEQADVAHKHVQRTRRLHQFGNGSLTAAARRYPLADEPTFDCADYCRCFSAVLAMLHFAKVGGMDDFGSAPTVWQ